MSQLPFAPRFWCLVLTLCLELRVQPPFSCSIWSSVLAHCSALTLHYVLRAHANYGAPLSPRHWDSMLPKPAVLRSYSIPSNPCARHPRYSAIMPSQVLRSHLFPQGRCGGVARPNVLLFGDYRWHRYSVLISWCSGLTIVCVHWLCYHFLGNPFLGTEE